MLVKFGAALYLSNPTHDLDESSTPPMTIDSDLQRHRETWHGFTQFVKFGSAAIALILIGMAVFLL
jgi:hypothetical protein